MVYGEHTVNSKRPEVDRGISKPGEEDEVSDATVDWTFRGPTSSTLPQPSIREKDKRWGATWSGTFLKDTLDRVTRTDKHFTD